MNIWKHPHRQAHVYRFIQSNSLTRLRRLKSPEICTQQAGNAQEQVCGSHLAANAWWGHWASPASESGHFRTQESLCPCVWLRTGVGCCNSQAKSFPLWELGPVLLRPTHVKEAELSDLYLNPTQTHAEYCSPKIIYTSRSREIYAQKFTQLMRYPQNGNCICKRNLALALKTRFSELNRSVLKYAFSVASHDLVQTP